VQRVQRQEDTQVARRPVVVPMAARRGGEHGCRRASPRVLDRQLVDAARQPFGDSDAMPVVARGAGAGDGQLLLLAVLAAQPQPRAAGTGGQHRGQLQRQAAVPRDDARRDGRSPRETIESGRGLLGPSQRVAQRREDRQQGVGGGGAAATLGVDVGGLHPAGAGEATQRSNRVGGLLRGHRAAVSLRPRRPVGRPGAAGPPRAAAA
jgi:hypothetical protein